MPAECVHQSGVWPCKLSFSCWLQGGKHAKGCGSNKWLFSCCIAQPHQQQQQQQHLSPLENLVDYGKLKMGLSSLPKRIMLRRRDDNELLSVKVSEQLHWSAGKWRHRGKPVLEQEIATIFPIEMTIPVPCARDYPTRHNATLWKIT